MKGSPTAEDALDALKMKGLVTVSTVAGPDGEQQEFCMMNGVGYLVMAGLLGTFASSIEVFGQIGDDEARLTANNIIGQIAEVSAYVGWFYKYVYEPYADQVAQ